ncbi:MULTISPECIES: ABC transporter ATP-binding protein [Rhizobium]|jgi:putative spermidine/putrescine transport system ATP-binding protein|uniref:ABC transporter ATP-binding protein n=2 Tax=Rhizobium TaxID=379 RepID=A0A6P1CFQ7_RHITR|nr:MULTISPECIES: ATP-binding cassette domain-containing protein [Rhizobium]AGB71699.1 Fe(3+) ABC transporter, ATP-binding protein [Rhizobium tropici CIAT 899]MBB3381837.1 putative spermidine/putrescine transport system ATP-binding protein [Rhizobium sp. BK098]MBB3423524.1 putative spermidine/putrescine transport system ATP-binding protein [Rhizobium sp. BK312]MBB3566716.1 putative spermidine/putrescine transport system ATP-binding protein [Rhizobium sp. BK491]MBB3613539.1 putative spermidine/p
MAFLELTHIKKSFGDIHVVHDFNMQIEKGEFVSFLGPSGCGKTTVLRMIAGFETPTAGTLSINGKDQRALKPNQRNIGMVFQAYALFPNMTVHDNVAFGLKVAGMAKPDIDKRVKEMLALIKLDHLAGRYPYQMSGGQQQRVALARAIAVKPQVLLLDEPLSALDAKIRISLREEIRAIQQQLGITTVFVTHDQEEALSISDRIVVMNAGRADQIGTPFEIYNKPATRFVASFVGTLNLIEGKVVDPDSNRIMIGDQGVTLKQSVTAYKPGDTVSLALRPEAGSLAESAKGDTALTGEVSSAHFLGSVIRTRMNVAGNTISFDMFNSPGMMPPSVGEKVTLRFASSDLLVIQD